MMPIPEVSAEQMAEVDRLAMESGLEVTMMMEHAALHMARLVQKLTPGGHVVVFVGRGHNGGDGIACVRHLANWGREVTLVLAEPEDFHKSLNRQHLDLAKLAGINIVQWENYEHPEASLFVDALLGYSVTENPRDPYDAIITYVNSLEIPVLAFDNPSGLDVTTGAAFSPCVEATETLTLALPKTGLSKAKDLVGDLYLADLGIPNFVYDQLGIKIETPLFKSESVIRLT